MASGGASRGPGSAYGGDRRSREREWGRDRRIWPAIGALIHASFALPARFNPVSPPSSPMAAHALPHATDAAATASVKREFGRFELRRLLGKSVASMLWLAFDPRTGAEAMLCLPRVQPVDAAALERWQRDARMAARLNHPNLAAVVEVGVQDHWPYTVVDRGQQFTLDEWIAAHPNPKPAEVVGWVCQALRGLAFAHDAGVAHLDVQRHHVLIDERGAICLIGLGVAGDLADATPAADGARSNGHSNDRSNDRSHDRSNERSMALDPRELRARRATAARDVLASGVLLQHLLTGQPALDQPDTALVIARIAPHGRELVRLPWSTPLPIPEALRAIANRCTSSQERLRYQSARTLLGALTGWLETLSEDGGGPLGVLLDRLRSVGHLPALPGLAARVARVTSLEGQRTDEIAAEVLDDMALTFELLRTLNSAQVQVTQVQGNGPVLTLRRIIALIGVNGVRLSANTLRHWPGPLDEGHANALQAVLDRVRLAGHVAQALRPKGYDAQVVYLITALQNLGRLMVRYHFADEADQIDQLMKPAAAGAEPGAAPQPGLSEQAAAFAVLGIDIESLGTAVARHWGLGDDVMHMARRLPPGAPVRKPDADDEVLRLTASAANEAVDVLAHTSAPRVGAALAQVAQRYARALGINARDLADALQAARDKVSKGLKHAA
jgi:eukaryotic-like serine/threonine-protein kinase